MTFFGFLKSATDVDGDTQSNAKRLTGRFEWGWRKVWVVRSGVDIKSGELWI